MTKSKVLMRNRQFDWYPNTKIASYQFTKSCEKVMKNQFKIANR